MTMPMSELGDLVFGTLAVSSVKALVLALAAWAAIRLLRPLRPALEHGIWAAVLIGMLLLPLTGLTNLIPTEIQTTLRTEVSGFAALTAGTVSAASIDETPAAARWQSWAGLLYLAILLAFFARLALGRWRAARLLAQTRPVTDPDAHHTFNAVLGSSGLANRVRLLASSGTSTPVTFGCLRPVVILPATWREWSPGKLHGVLTHEVSHVVRRDSWIASAAAVNCALCWFHPLAWWLKARLTVLAELACDDRSVLLTQDREGYAETLLSVASRCHHKQAQPAWPAPAMARISRVGERIERILSTTTADTGLLGRRASISLIALLVVGLLILGAVSPVAAQQGITLAGTVADRSGARIPEAMIFVSDLQDPDFREVTTTGPDGSYSLSGLQAGRPYQVDIQSPGFIRSSETITIEGDQPLDVTLEVGRITETVVVSAARLGAPPVSSGARQRIQVGGNVQKARLTNHVAPRYPPDARSQGVGGTVLIEAVISPEGVPSNLELRNSLVDPRLAQAAFDAVSQWRYKPTRLNGQPVEIATTVTVTFKLTN